LKRVGVTRNGAVKDNFGANEATPQFIVVAGRFASRKPSQGCKTSCGYHVILSNIYTGKGVCLKGTESETFWQRRFTHADNYRDAHTAL